MYDVSTNYYPVGIAHGGCSVGHIMNYYCSGTYFYIVAYLHVLNNTYVRSNIYIIAYSSRSSVIAAYCQQLRDVTIPAYLCFSVNYNTESVTYVHSGADLRAGRNLHTIFVGILAIHETRHKAQQPSALGKAQQSEPKGESQAVLAAKQCVGNKVFTPPHLPTSPKVLHAPRSAWYRLSLFPRKHCTFY